MSLYLYNYGVHPFTTINPLIAPGFYSAQSNKIYTDKYTLNNKSDINSNKPDLLLKHFRELTPQNVRSQGDIRGMVFDVDDTLSKFQLGNRSIPPKLKKRLKTLQDSGIKLGIASNNPNSKATLKFQKELANAGIQTAVVTHAQKPSVKGLKMMQHYFDLPADQIMMVGDSPFTDVPAGKQAGFKTAQVDWFGSDKLHKKAMIELDKVLLEIDKIKNIYTPGLNQPKFFPPLEKSSDIAIQ